MHHLVASLAALPVLWRGTQAAQPGAAEAVAAPMRNLTWGQLNFLHTTDTHGWLAGHLQEPQYSADWGDYVSFAAHMRSRANALGSDLILVDTGDRVEGNGLYDGSRPKGLFLNDIFSAAPVDVLCPGNHELYQAGTARREHDVVVPSFEDAYLATNLDYIDPKTGEQVPMAKHRFRRFKTPNQGVEILSFGFIFDFTGNADNSVVLKVEDVVKEQWFQDEIRKPGKDLILVAGHVGLRMDEFNTIYTAIRQLDWDTPVVFFGGHAHVRDTVRFDDRGFAMASGRYLETVGWMSVDGIKPSDKDAAALAGPKFSRRYIDNNLFGYRYHTSLNETTFPTDKGRQVSKLITKARAALNLDEKYGCAPRHLWMNRAPYPSNESIYSWLDTEVLPDIIVNPSRAEKPRLAIINTGGIRFDIFEGPFTRDSAYLVSPFTSGFRYVPSVPYRIASRVLGLLNTGGTIFAPLKLEDLSHLSIPQQFADTHPQPYGSESAVDESHLDLRRRAALGQVPLGEEAVEKPSLIAGYTTKDDLGDDGDDTIHAKVDFYSVPNCVQAEIGFSSKDEEMPEEVDLVFIDFIEPWMLMALKFAGGDYEKENVEKYMDGTLTYKMTRWIADNWDNDC